MEFVKVGKNYMIKGSNGFIISKEQKERYEKNELNPEHKPCDCGKKNKKHFPKEVHNDTIEETTESI